MAEAGYVTLEGRAGMMARALHSALTGRGIEGADGSAVERAFELAMAPRLAAISDDHDPTYLHPGRSALILLHDVDDLGPSALLLAALHESVDLGLRVSSEVLSDAIGEAVDTALEAIPLPGDERLVERLVTLDREAGLAAVAERLDHLRHLHLRDDLVDTWSDTHAEVSEAWLPFTIRSHPQLSRRYAHWVRTFTKRIGSAQGTAARVEAP